MLKICPGLALGLWSVFVLGQVDDSKSQFKIKNKYSVKVGIEGAIQDSSATVGRTVSAKISPRLDLYPDSRSGIAIAINAEAKTGGLQEDIKSESNPLSLQEANYSLNTDENFGVSVGVLTLQGPSSPLLISPDRSFVGAKEVWSWEQKDLKGQITLRQHIPSSKSLTPESGRYEDTPTFFTESFTLTSNLNVFEARFNVSHFSFNDLAGSVASQSSPIGNTTIDHRPGWARFAYGFEGWDLSAEFKNLEWRERPSIAAGLLINNGAPDDRNKAQFFAIGASWALPSQIEITPRVSRVINQSDSAPAAYIGAKMIHPNQSGWIYELKTRFENYGLNVDISILNSDAINDWNGSKREQSIWVRIETDYASI